MVIVLEDHAAVTPAGKPDAIPIPVAPLAVCLMLGDSGVLIQSVGEDEAAVTVIFGLTRNELLLTVVVPHSLVTAKETV